MFLQYNPSSHEEVTGPQGSVQVVCQKVFWPCEEVFPITELEASLFFRFFFFFLTQLWWLFVGKPVKIHVGVQRVLKWHANPWCGRISWWAGAGGLTSGLWLIWEDVIFTGCSTESVQLEFSVGAADGRGFTAVGVGSGNEAFLKLGGQLVPVLEVQSISSIAPVSRGLQPTVCGASWHFTKCWSWLVHWGTAFLAKRPHPVCCGPKLWGQLKPWYWSRVTGCSELVSSCPCP